MTTRKVFLSLLAVLVSAGTVWPCTNLIVTKGASKDGSIMVTYSADSHQLYGELYFWPAAKWPEGTMLKIFEWIPEGTWERFRRPPLRIPSPGI